MKIHLKGDQGTCFSDLLLITLEISYKSMFTFLFFSSYFETLYVYLCVHEIVCVNKTKPLTAT